jgi:hypothetical protein
MLGGKVQLHGRVKAIRRHKHEKKTDPNFGKHLVEPGEPLQFAFDLFRILTVEVPFFGLDSDQMAFWTFDPHKKIQIF